MVFIEKSQYPVGEFKLLVQHIFKGYQKMSAFVYIYDI